MRKKPKFVLDENVVCQHKGEFYLSRVLRVKKAKSSFQVSSIGNVLRMNA